MPHIHLETTADLPENAHIPDILEALVAQLSTYDTFQPKSIKAYHSLRSNWFLGDGAPAGFAHCTVAIISGRAVELRRTMATEMFAEMKKHFQMSLENNEVGLTLELREMDAETYQK